jgi:uncharacterized protein YraI
MRVTLIAGAIVTALSAVPINAAAAPAYATANIRIFAGPGNDYPAVGRLSVGAAVDVHGCLNDYSWCDVSFGPERGWVYGGDIATPYGNGPAPVLQYGPQLGFPTITFSMGDYWDHHYRSRPFYGERSRWEHHGDDGHEQGGGQHGRQPWEGGR